MKVRTVVILFFIFSLSAVEAKLLINGSIRNDSIGTIHNFDSKNSPFIPVEQNSFEYNDIFETKLVIEKKSKKWKFYSDTRLLLYYGKAITYSTEKTIDINLMRIFIRLFTDMGDFTLGKTYINFGVTGLFNPFEFDKLVNINDLQYDKAGLMSLEYVLDIEDVFLFKIYGGVHQDELEFDNDRVPTNIDPEYKAGMSLQGYAGSFDYGGVVNRLGTGRNIFGAYFKGDIEVGVNGAYAFHSNDSFDSFFHEVTTGIDYSYFSGNLLLAMTFYYNSIGGLEFSDYVQSEDYFFSAKYYVYGTISGKIDEFTSFRLDVFGNMADYSFMLASSSRFVIANGLTLALGLYIPVGRGDKEFSWKYSGYSTVLIRVEGKF